MAVYNFATESETKVEAGLEALIFGAKQAAARIEGPALALKEAEEIA